MRRGRNSRPADREADRYGLYSRGRYIKIRYIQKAADARGPRGGIDMDVTLKVDGMHCAACEMRIAEALSEVPGVKGAKADAKAGSVRFEAASPQARKAGEAAIRKEGYRIKG